MALGVWLLVAVSYEAGPVVWPDFTFIHTFLWPAMVLVALMPLSFSNFVSSKWFAPGIAIWEGVMIPGVYLVGRRITGLGSHCDKAAILGGGVAFLAMFGYWAITAFTTFCRRKLDRSIQAATV